MIYTLVVVAAVILFLVAAAAVISILKVASDYDDHSEYIYNAHLALSQSDKRVYNYLNEFDNWWPGYKQISVVLGMKQSHIKQSCKKLESLGYLKFKKIREKNGRLQGSGYFVSHKI